MKKLLVLDRVHDAGLALARARDDIELEVLDEITPERLRAAVAGAHGIVVRTTAIDRELIASAQVLEVVSRHGVGYDGVDVGALTERGIPLTITIDGNAVSVAEHAMAFLLALAKQARRYDANTRSDGWSVRNTVDAVELAGRRLLIIGFGRTGSRVAPRAQAFDMEVLACDPYIDQGLIEAAGCTPVADFREVLPDVDAVTVHTPLTEETRGMVGAEAIARMRPTAYLINCARGGIVDEPALAAALRAGNLAGAGLDVFEGEPTPPGRDHPLFGLDNAIVSPHTAGITREAAVRMATGAVRNTLDALDGRLSPEVVVNREVLAPCGARPSAPRRRNPMDNRLRKVWDEGRGAVNAWLSIPNAITAEVTARQGFDSITIDLQHGLNDYSSALPMLQALSLGGATPLARVPWLEPGIIMKLLDAGALGLICPMVNTREDAEAFVRFANYAPVGTRSFGPTRAGLVYGADYAAQANAQVVTLAMVETVEALDNLEAIVSTPGLTGVYIGPSDLSLSMGYTPKLDQDEPAVVEAIGRILAAARAAGVRAGIHCLAPSYASAMLERGFDLITLGSDVRIYASALGQALSEVRAGQAV
jgi:phosphoglycerate dehydrogenase-like enzyme/2-keto-3-deoxy-L-rhamnonate aldolase RhmA